ncbi:hypothetical protein AXF42_Ash002333 [Apostasia shenzhenica]|uniref:Retrotransposon gag domain-containing protein n=1 Tax=Apostasia shenzhenica TaxID=1088818 RepID=A0A2I0AN88_9ASPA|nr:hypothetical protein AXF42_Ash002333 [Apostasia shenzhenica]
MRHQHFEGSIDPMIFENWLVKMEKVFENIRCLVDRKVSMVASVIDGAADNWWTNYRRVHLSDKDGRSYHLGGIS